MTLHTQGGGTVQWDKDKKRYTFVIPPPGHKTGDFMPEEWGLVHIQEEEEYLLLCGRCNCSIRGDNKKVSFLDTIISVDDTRKVIIGICYICQQAEQAA